MNESSGHSSYVDTATCKDRKRRESRPVSSPEDSEKRTRHAVSAVCVARYFVRFGCSCTLPVRPCSLTMRAHVSCHPAHPSPRPPSLSADRLALPVLVPVCFCRIPNAMHVSWPVALGAKAPPHHLLSWPRFAHSASRAIPALVPWHPQPNTCGAYDLAVPQLAQNLLSAAGNCVPHWKQNLFLGAAPSAAATVKQEAGWP